MNEEQIGHYRLEHKLGEGTYGVVYRGVHIEDPALKVALKLLHPHMLSDPRFMESLKAECRRLDALDHSGIVRFKDLIVTDGKVAMVLELLEGRDLHDTVRDLGPLPIEQVTRVAEEALSALAYAHKQGIVHRDIKPSNLFLCEDGRVKILDFGIARAAFASGTQLMSGTMKGTLAYMAPERFDGETTPASDVYAMGLVLWELITGKVACDRSDHVGIIGWHATQFVPDFRAERPDCPAWLAELVESLTRRAQGERPVDGATALVQMAALRTKSPPSAPAPIPRGPGTVELSSEDVAEAKSAHAATKPTPATAPKPKPTQKPTPVPKASKSVKSNPLIKVILLGGVVVMGLVFAVTVVGISLLNSDDNSTEVSAAKAENKLGEFDPENLKALLAEVEDLDSCLADKSAAMTAEATKKWGHLKVLRDASNRGEAQASLAMAKVRSFVGQYRAVEVVCGNEHGQKSANVSVVEMATAQAWLTARGGVDFDFDYAESLGMKFVWIPAGSFKMGCTAEQGSDCESDEKPAHKATLSRSFWMQTTEVTQGQWRAVMGKKPSHFSKCGDDCPVETVSWDEAVAFAQKLSAKEGLRGGSVYRLPTEAEWEYAARAGQGTKYAGSNSLDAVAWHSGNSGSKTQRVGQKSPNAWGLYDMTGNVYEWTADWYGGYSSRDTTNPEGASSGSYRVLRGGSWGSGPRYARVAYRGRGAPDDRHNGLGLRLLRTIP